MGAAPPFVTIVALSCMLGYAGCGCMQPAAVLQCSGGCLKSWTLQPATSTDELLATHGAATAAVAREGLHVLSVANTADWYDTTHTC